MLFCHPFGVLLFFMMQDGSVYLWLRQYRFRVCFIGKKRCIGQLWCFAGFGMRLVLCCGKAVFTWALFFPGYIRRFIFAGFCMQLCFSIYTHMPLRWWNSGLFTDVRFTRMSRFICADIWTAGISSVGIIFRLSLSAQNSVTDLMERAVRSECRASMAVSEWRQCRFIVRLMGVRNKKLMQYLYPVCRSVGAVRWFWI